MVGFILHPQLNCWLVLVGDFPQSHHSDAFGTELNDGCEAGGHQDEMITSLCDARDPRPSTAGTISMDVFQNPW
jgi:hypothetical protein